MLLILTVNIQIIAQDYNRGIGIYPGNPKRKFFSNNENRQKKLQEHCLVKTGLQLGSYDYNLTAQLITYGIIESKIPEWIVTTNSDGTFPRNERDYFIDRHARTRKEFDGNNSWITMELTGNYIIPKVNGFELSGNISTDTAQTEIKPWQITVSGSNKGKNWKILAKLTNNKILGDTLTGYWRIFYPKNYRVFKQEIKLDEAVNYKFYHADFSSLNVKTWFIGEFAMTNDGNYCNISGPFNFLSAWKSLGSKKEWVYVDLNALCSFDNIKLYWLKRAASGTVQVSGDLKSWKEISVLPITESLIDDIKFNKPIEGRYVRLMLDNAASEEDGYILSEMEVFGKGASSASQHTRANIETDGNIKLSGGRWKVQRSSLLKDSMGEVSKVGFNDSAWITATVLGTVLSSYFNAGVIPDPNYSDNMLLISDSYFYSDFWYRDEFTVPKNYSGKKYF